MGNIFTQRVECAWNELLHTVIEVGTMSIFKGYLDKHMDGNGLEGYRPREGK